MSLFRDTSLSKIHFIAVCGTAMASVAAELKRAGFQVTGSDSGIYPPMSDFLHDQGVAIREGFKPEHVPPDALIVVGNAVSRGNPELETAMDRNNCLISLPELISRRYLAGKRSIVVAGTHGKTTITAMIAHILREAGRDPGWMVGGIPFDLEVPCWMGSGEEFVIEGDEYDSVWYDKRPKFFHYKPQIAVITSVEFDHADIYPDIKAVETVFERFTKMLPRNGKLVVCRDFPRALKVSENVFCRLETYGTNRNADWRMKNSTGSGASSLTGEFTGPKGLSGTVELGMVGEHNLLNALAALIVATTVGVDLTTVLSVLKGFRGIKRRLELLIDTGLVAVWEDFAHHPTAIRTTLEGLRRRYPGRRLWALLEPRSNTMVRNYHAAELMEALSLADKVTLAPLHREEKIPAAERLDTRKIIRTLETRGVSAQVTMSFDEILREVKGNVTGGDVLVIMSNGGFGGIKEKIVNYIRERTP